MTWQPEPDQSRPDSPGSDSRSSPPGYAAAAARPGGRWRRRGRQTAFGALLAAGLVGLAVSAVGIAHQLLPRHFTPAQQRAIATWEVDRRWRAVPAGTIFPASVPYYLSPSSLNSTSGLTLHARLLGISPATSCAQAVSGAAIRLLRTHGCSDALRATYADASGSLVATVAVAVLPRAAAAGAVVNDLSQDGLATSPKLVHALAISRTLAAGFGAAQRQLSYVTAAESYVIMATVGFADDRGRIHVAADVYQDSELSSLAIGLVGKAKSVLGGPPAAPECPGTPGC
ncbi:MAG TPA: hypothetical protein VMA73_09250 [Streptosporangiaceae bacterium]|nr:hypothetical protein [Streptosporangiaceae bacterium]